MNFILPSSTSSQLLPLIACDIYSLYLSLLSLSFHYELFSSHKCSTFSCLSTIDSIDYCDHDNPSFLHPLLSQPYRITYVLSLPLHTQATNTTLNHEITTFCFISHALAKNDRQNSLFSFLFILKN